MLAVVGFGEDVAPGVDGEGAAEVVEMGVFAAAVDAQDDGLVFDGAGDEEGAPVFASACGPVGDDGEDRGSLGEAGAEEFGEAEVVADGGADGERVGTEDQRPGGDVGASVEAFAFAAVGEGVEFVVGGDGVAGGVEGDGAVEGGLCAVCGGEDGEAGVDEAAALFGLS